MAGRQEITSAQIQACYEQGVAIHEGKIATL